MRLAKQSSSKSQKRARARAFVPRGTPVHDLFHVEHSLEPFGSVHLALAEAVNLGLPAEITSLANNRKDMTLRLTDKQRFSLASEAQRQASFYHARGNKELYHLWLNISEAIIRHWKETTTITINGGEQAEETSNPFKAND